MTKTATVSLYGNGYEVDSNLVGLKVELLFDPFDLAEIRVRYRGQPMGTAAPVRIGRHVHPRAKPEVTPPPAKPTGIDYLGLVDARLAEATRRRISYAALPEPAGGHTDGHGVADGQPDDARGAVGRHDDARIPRDDAGQPDVVAGNVVVDAHDDANRQPDNDREQP